MAIGAIIIGAIILIVGTGVFLWAFSQLQRYGWDTNLYSNWPDQEWHAGGVYTSSQHDTAYNAVIGAGIVMVIGLVICIYGAAAKGGADEDEVYDKIKEELKKSPERKRRG